MISVAVRLYVQSNPRDMTGYLQRARVSVSGGQRQHVDDESGQCFDKNYWGRANRLATHGGRGSMRGEVQERAGMMTRS